MRYLPLVAPLVALGCGVSAHAMLPSPTTDTVSYTANPTAKPNAPTLNMPTASTSKVVSTPKTNIPTVNLPAASLPTSADVSASANPSSADFISVVNAFVVKSNNGVETLVPVTLSTPVQAGDVLEYQGLFTNTGDRVRKMDVTLSIADGLELVGGISPQQASGSNNGTRFARMPVRANINGQVQNLPLSEYKALRWTVDNVGLGGTVVVKYRAKVK